jgi:AAA lid domain
MFSCSWFLPMEAGEFLVRVPGCLRCATGAAEEAALEILRGLKERYEAHHKCTFTDEALQAAVQLSHRYIADRFLPDKVGWWGHPDLHKRDVLGTVQCAVLCCLFCSCME